MFKALITGVLILSAAVPANAQQVGPGVGRGTPAYVCTNETTGRLTMRRGPGQRNRQILQIPRNADILVHSTTEGKDGFTWFRVSYNGKQRWVCSDFVCYHNN